MLNERAMTATRWEQINQATFTQERKPTKLKRTAAHTMHTMCIKLHCRKGKESHTHCQIKHQILFSQRYGRKHDVLMKTISYRAFTNSHTGPSVTCLLQQRKQSCLRKLSAVCYPARQGYRPGRFRMK